MKRNFIYLAVLTVISLLLVWMFAADDNSSDDLQVKRLLLPEISKKINDVDRVEIISAGDQPVATMVRATGSWQLEEMGGYRADWSRLQALLAGLAQSVIVETKTDNPEFYARLGVEDISASDAGGVMVTLGIGDQVESILVGREAQGRSGQYVRLANSSASALVDRELDVSTDLLDWVDKRVVNIEASEVAEVEIIHPDGEGILVTRVSADQTDFDLVELPQDREIKSSWAVNSLGSVLSRLDMESVRPDDSIDWSGAVKFRLLTFSGMEIISETVTVGDEYLLRLQADYPRARVTNGQDESTETSPEQLAIERQAVDEVMSAVEDINQKVTTWAYAISKQKHDLMVSKMENLLKPLTP